MLNTKPKSKQEKTVKTIKEILNNAINQLENMHESKQKQVTNIYNEYRDSHQEIPPEEREIISQLHAEMEEIEKYLLKLDNN